MTLIPWGWARLRIRDKVAVVVLVLCVPLMAALAVHLTLIKQLITVQQQHARLVVAGEHVQILHRLAVDIEDGFRGYLLTKQDRFLAPMAEAARTLPPTIASTTELFESMPSLREDLRRLETDLQELLATKQRLVRRFQGGDVAEVLSYVQSGKGLALSDSLRENSRAFGDRLNSEAQRFDVREAQLAERAFWGLLIALAGGLGLGLIAAGMLSKSIVQPITVLDASVARFDAAGHADVPMIPVTSHDEIGRLARSYEEMVSRIRRHITELETINAIGNEINTIGPGGLDGVLYRITNRAVEMLPADVCLLMVRNERMGCWIVEAASGEWAAKLKKSVMLWEEFPVSVQAFESRQPAFGEDLRSDDPPEVVRRNLLGGSMMALPLLSHNTPFGVLVLLRNRTVSAAEWNLRLAKGFADEAAIAIVNARLFEASTQERKALELRLRELEHLAETLAHDMKAPGERMEGLALLLLEEYGTRLDERGTRLLRLLNENGKTLIERVENILDVARVGAGQAAVEAIDPGHVLRDVLKRRAGELKERGMDLRVGSNFPPVACHREYLYQVFDNLISNAIKFSDGCPNPQVSVEAERKEDRVEFRVADNGPGIPVEYRERVFTPFFRLQPGAAKGTGIGLTIVKRIIEFYDGKLLIDSNGGSGCVFTFTLPAIGHLSTPRPDSEPLGECRLV